MAIEVKYYIEAWYKVEYIIEETTVYFKAWKITGLDETEPETSTVENEHSIDGYIKWDGSMEFVEHKEHYCGIYAAEQTLLLMKEIYRFKGSLGGIFLEEDDE